MSLLQVYMMSDRSPEKIYRTHYIGIRLSVLNLTLFWVGRYIQESPIFDHYTYFSPSKFVINRVCPLNQCVTSHTTMVKMV